MSPLLRGNVVGLRTANQPATGVTMERGEPLARKLLMKRSSVLWPLVVMLVLSDPGRGAEFVVLSERTWDAYVPAGKEVDAIYGDYVLRNDLFTAVIAQGAPWRNANMTVRDVGGCVIDLTVNKPQSDQLSAYYPGARRFDYTLLYISLPEGGMIWNLEQGSVKQVQQAVKLTADELAKTPVRVEAAVIEVVFGGLPSSGPGPDAQLTYTIHDGDPALGISTTVRNVTNQPVPFFAVDDFRADRTFMTAPRGDTTLVWVYDRLWGQAYGVRAPAHRMRLSGNPAAPRVVEFLINGAESARVNLNPGQSVTVQRELLCASDLLGLKAVDAAKSGIPLASYRLVVRDGRGDPVPAADITVDLVERVEGQPRRVRYAMARTLSDGTASLQLPQGNYQISVAALGYGRRELTLSVSKDTAGNAPTELKVGMDTPARVIASITDEHGQPIPCKVQFIGINGTETPNWFDDTGEHLVRNLYYSHNGKFTLPIPPGDYRVIISRGPEYDAVDTKISVSPGTDVPLKAQLRRVVQTPGWVSADFHSHSSPSGDNVSSQLGRVLNHLCEHIEFAPCTEHNRLDTYVPHLKRLGAEHLLATCVGIELTGSPGTVNHQNAFPLIRKPRTQDNGAPQPDPNPEVQIRRLALWDNGSEKLVQTNHPDFGEMFFDRDGDGRYDGGYKGMFAFQDVIEVHPHEGILSGRAFFIQNDRIQNHRIFNWLQMINIGHYIPGVVNTDAHYNFHGVGWLRNYVRSSTDDPAKINVMEMVRNAEKGHIIMTNGPYLEVEASTEGRAEPAIAGDLLVAKSGKVTLHVRVQCPNWFDVDRVQILRNGRPDPNLNWTRKENPDAFSDEVVKFDRKIELRLKQDEHLIVVTVGENSRLGDVMGPAHANRRPVALNNPIFVDVDGDGFEPNGDPLDYPLPLKGGRPVPRGD